MKNPVANLGKIVGEGSKRIRRSVGLDAPNISEHVHQKLREEAQILSKNIMLFSSAVEYLLIKYTTSVVLEQMILTRLANAAIDIYTMLVLLSRTSCSLNKNITSAEIELNMCKVFCSEVTYIFLMRCFYFIFVKIISISFRQM